MTILLMPLLNEGKDNQQFNVESQETFSVVYRDLTLNAEGAIGWSLFAEQIGKWAHSVVTVPPWPKKDPNNYQSALGSSVLFKHTDRFMGPPVITSKLEGFRFTYNEKTNVLTVFRLDGADAPTAGGMITIEGLLL